MGELVQWELQYLAVVVTTGIGLATVYDVLRIFRRLVRHGTRWIAVEDITFWMLASLTSFVVCFCEDAGNVRWFSLAGELLGACMYHWTISNFLVKYISLILFFPIKVLKKALKKLIKCIIIKDTRE